MERFLYIVKKEINKVKNYIVKATIELEATSEPEAEDIVLGMELVDLEGNSIENYIEIEEVKEVG